MTQATGQQKRVRDSLEQKLPCLCICERMQGNKRQTDRSFGLITENAALVPLTLMWPAFKLSLSFSCFFPASSSSPAFILSIPTGMTGSRRRCCATSLASERVRDGGEKKWDTHTQQVERQAPGVQGIEVRPNTCVCVMCLLSLSSLAFWGQAAKLHIPPPVSPRLSCCRSLVDVCWQHFEQKGLRRKGRSRRRTRGEKAEEKKKQRRLDDKTVPASLITAQID